MKISSISVLNSILTILLFVGAISAQVTFQEFKANGQLPVLLNSTINSFRTAIGGNNNGVGNSFRTGRREINWDGVPDSNSTPNPFPANFFNVNSPRGVVLSNIKSSSGSLGNSRFLVSADSDNPTNTPVRFGDFNSQYPTIFRTFSSERLFLATAATLTEVIFFIPGTKIPATVSSFGVVFCDVDFANNTSIEIYSPDGSLLRTIHANPENDGLSFVGVVVSGERIARVIIKAGNLRPAILNEDDNSASDSKDVVVMDDFIYGEPRAAEFHSSDFDGDGVSDSAVFRPSQGLFIILNSGSNTVTFDPWGIDGDIPVNGDFDGDKLADAAIYRPSLGQWWIKKSSDGTHFGTQFGAAGDKPVPGDYDKDGKTDIVNFRPSSGQWFVLRSSDNFSSFFGFQFGANGDLPVGASTGP